MMFVFYGASTDRATLEPLSLSRAIIEFNPAGTILSATERSGAIDHTGRRE
jgi:hypothetical protein